MQVIRDIAVNLAANTIWWCLVIIIGLFAIAIRARKRRALLKFLGLTRQQSRLTVYLSALDLLVQVTNLYSQQRDWSGMALSAAEFESIPSVDRWLSQINKTSDSFLDSLFDYLTPTFLRLPKVDLHYLPSPRAVDELHLHDQTLIVIGGTAHNAFAKAYSDKNMMIMETDDAQKAIRIDHGKHAGRTFRPTRQRPSDGAYETEVAKLEKIVDDERKTVSFIAEGVGTNGTLSAVHYLITHWEDLWRQHREKPFAICIECPTRDLDKTGYMHPSVIVTLAGTDL